MVGLPADCCVVVGLGASVTVVIAWGKRPVPFRTRKLRLTAPMVLQPGGCGRVGHCRTLFSRVGASLWLATGDSVCGVATFVVLSPLFCLTSLATLGITRYHVAVLYYLRT